MNKVLIAAMLLAGCGDSDKYSDEAAAPAAPSAPVAPGAPPSASGSLTGLYEGGQGAPTNQLCMIDKGAAGTQFGLVVWGGNMHSCAGSGKAVRTGGVLRLEMAGDEACAIEARIDGGAIILPAAVPEGCSYYCGARAQLTGASFRRTGATSADAMKAVDLVGEPLCGR
jgi:hypothetical protein